jgi:hypothetical protein
MLSPKINPGWFYGTKSGVFFAKSYPFRKLMPHLIPPRNILESDPEVGASINGVEVEQIGATPSHCRRVVGANVPSASTELHNVGVIRTGANLRGQILK